MLVVIDYSYDDLSRLIEADYNNGTNVYNYVYDVAGNLVDYDGVSRTFNEANQMVNDGTNTLTYDNNGNLKNDGTNAYTWDRANRLLSVGNHSYVYDGLGNRVQQTVSSVVTDYLNDVQPALTKLLKQTAGASVEQFVHAPRGIHAVDDGTDWNFYAQDGLGSVRAVVNDMAVVQTSMSFDPYGNPMASYGAGFGFTGEQTDANMSFDEIGTLASWNAQNNIKHFVAITGLSTYQQWNRGDRWIRVINPFFNRQEYYKWDDFALGDSQIVNPTWAMFWVEPNREPENAIEDVERWGQNERRIPILYSE